MAIASNQIKPPMWAPGINWSHPLAKGLVFVAPMWFDTAAQIRDLSGHGRHLIPANTPVYEEDTKGKAWRFTPGSAERATYIVDCPITAYPFSMACWFKSSTIISNQTLIWIGDRHTANDTTALQLRGGTPGDPVRAFSGKYGASTVQTANTTTGYSVNKWHHACGTWGGVGNRSAFIDGGGKNSSSGVVGAMTGHDSVAIGRLGDQSPGVYMNGYIMLPCIWNRVLTDSEVLQLFTDPWCLITIPKRE